MDRKGRVYLSDRRVVSYACVRPDASFCATGLERSSSLAADIEWFKETYKLAAPSVHPDGPGATYAKLIADLAKTDPQAFICHYYNFYFAHTAGGRMIGNKVGLG